MITYCSKLCAQADWAAHKVVCGKLRTANAGALAAHESQGGRKQDFNQKIRDAKKNSASVPGLTTEVQLLAWAARSENPVIYMVTFPDDIDGSKTQITIMPRRLWDDDPCFLDNYFSDSDAFRFRLRELFGQSSFDTNTSFACFTKMNHQGKRTFGTLTQVGFNDEAISGAAIIEALTAATRAEDIADAFAWIEKVCQASKAQEMMQYIRDRATMVHDSFTPRDSVPIPSRALNNEVTITMMSRMGLECKIRLTGLRGNASLNGKEGVIRGQDSVCEERWKARMDDGTYVSVKAGNFVRIGRGNYKRISP